MPTLTRGRLQRQYDEAIPLYKEALAVLARPCLKQRALATEPLAQEASLGPHHPSVGSTLHNLAGMYLQKRDLVAAAQACSDALSRKEASLGRLHPEYAASLAQLAEVYRHQGRLGDAAVLLRESTDVLEAEGAGQSRTAVARLARLAGLLSELEQPAAAVLVHRRLVQAAEAAGEEDSALRLAQALAGLAEALSATPDGASEAVALCRRALSLTKPGDSPALVAALQRRLADALLLGCRVAEQLARLAEAEQLLERALPALRSAASAGYDRGATRETDSKRYELAAALVAHATLRRLRGCEGAEAARAEAEDACRRVEASTARTHLEARMRQRA